LTVARHAAENLSVTDTIRGACLCGAVRFSIAPPYRWFAHCHCSMCRKHHGSLFGTFLGVARVSLRWQEGARDIVHYRATDAFERPFCRHCGSTLPGVSEEEGYWNVPAGLVDDELGARPRSHIFVASRSPLTALDDVLPRHDAYPPGIDLPTLATRAPFEVAAVSGSCLCGAVTFSASVAPKLLVNCYCSLCRRSRAAAFGSTLLVPRERFAWRSGAERVRSYALPAPRQYGSEFCGDCGSPAPSAAPGSPVAMLPAGAIDTPLPRLPAVHLYVASKAPWYEISAAGERFDELPPPQRFTELFQ
jgi:hypothetical protein